MCATTDTTTCWNEIDFKKAEQSVKKLQKRIAVAYKNQRYDVAITLQHRLIHSFYAKALAVKRVTSNRGKHTPGIDGIVWNTPELKFEAIASLKRRGYKPQPLRRTYIPKPNGKKRPLSIPTMQDRAMQTLYKFALEPIAEITADNCSYAYRPKRACRNAICQCCEILSEYPSIKWMLKIDIKSCFDNISHAWILNHIFMDKVILKKFIKSPYVYDLTLYPTTNGIPQGGAISSVICNMTLDGLESRLSELYGCNVHVVRYADDILIFGIDPLVLMQSVAPTIQKFLSERNLELAERKTQLTHLQHGVDFLGWKLYEEKNQIITIPAREKIDSLLAKIETALTCGQYVTLQEQCAVIKPKIEGWLKYYIGMAQEQSLYGVEYEILSLLHSLGYNQFAEFIKQIFSKYISL